MLSCWDDELPSPIFTDGLSISSPDPHFTTYTSHNGLSSSKFTLLFPSDRPVDLLVKSADYFQEESFFSLNDCSRATDEVRGGSHWSSMVNGAKGWLKQRVRPKTSFVCFSSKADPASSKYHCSFELHLGYSIIWLQSVCFLLRPKFDTLRVCWS